MEIKLIKSIFGLHPKKLLMLLMRTFIFLLCTTVFSFNTEISSAQEKVKIDHDKTVSVNEVFNIIMQQTKYHFLYPENLFEGAPEVQLTKGTITVSKLLQQSIKNNSFNIILSNDDTILIKEKSKRQQRQVTGKVTDQSGLPIPGATVQIKGTTTGVATNFDGTYNITAPDPQSVLVFTSLGFKDQEITVGDQLQINVELEEDVTTLDDVVVTGYQKIAKERSTGAYAKPEMETVKARSTSMNVVQRLEGLVPGLVINNAPDAISSANKIQIRGLSSINGNQTPIFVVDGVVVTNIESINPQDVEDITVLKDAVAASIYGSRSSNGVIVITTKRGGFNSKLKVDYDMFTNFQGKPDIRYKPVLSSQQYIQTAKELFDPVTFPYGELSTYSGTGDSSLLPHDQILYDQYNGVIDQATADARLNELANISNLDQIEDVLYRSAMLTNHTLSVQSGGQNHAVYGSVAYTNAQSSTPGEKNETFKLNLRQDFKFGKRVKLRLNTDLTNQIMEANKALTADNTMVPYALFKNPDGTNAHMEYMQLFSRDERAGYEAASGIGLDYVPLDDFNTGSTDTNNLNVRISTGINIELFKGLKFEGTYGYEHGNRKFTSFDSQDSYQVRSDVVFFTEPAATPGGSPIYHLPNTGGYYKTSNGLSKSWTVRNQLNYNKDWNEGLHKITILAGQEAQEQYLNSSNTATIGYDPRTQLSPNLDYTSLNRFVRGVVVGNFRRGFSVLRYSSSNGIETPYAEVEFVSRFKSYYANGSYTFNDKYTLSGSWRIDESNLFGIEKSAQNRPVWSTGFKWVASSEKFLENLNWLDYLAVRTSYGITGNAPNPGGTTSFDVLRTRNAFSVYTNALFANYIQTPGNSNLTWESTKNLNLGLDFKFFNNRIGGSIDYYHNKTEDLLGLLDTNTFSGYSQISGNAGDMENKGIELGLQTVNLTGDFSWLTNVVMSHNENKITSINALFQNTNGDDLIGDAYIEGYSASAVFAYDFVGLNNEGSPEIRLADGTITSLSNAAQIEDIKYMGTFQPKWSGGVSNTFSYKGLSLNANVIYNLGHVLYVDAPTSYNGRLLTSTGSTINSGNIHADFANRWKQPGDEANTNIPAYQALNNTIDRNTLYYRRGDINVVSGSYIKLKDITLAYNFPDPVIEKINANNISLRFQVSNLMLWKSNNKGIDPEFHAARSARRYSPVNQGTMTLGLHVSF